MLGAMDSWINWTILALGLVSYVGLFDLILGPRTQTWQQRCGRSLPLLQAMLAALPLLGLLGTISGLLQTFVDLSAGQVDYQTMMAGGVGQALSSTQLGLLLVVPGLLLHYWLKGQLEVVNEGLLAEMSSQNNEEFDGEIREAMSRGI